MGQANGTIGRSSAASQRAEQIAVKSSTVAGTSQEWLWGVIPLACSAAVLRLLDS